jgi:hypothetical protein
MIGARASESEDLKKIEDMRAAYDAVVKEKAEVEEIERVKLQRFLDSLRMKLAKLRRDTEASVATLGRRSAEFPTGATLSDFLEWFRTEVAVMSITFVECNKNITCYALICVFQMLAGEGCEHLLELKKLALSCDASVLQDFPVEAGWIAKRLVKNWWTKHGLPYCMQKIEEENRVSFGTLSLGVTLCMPLFNFLFLISLKLMKVSKVVMATSMSSLSVMAHKRRFFAQSLRYWDGWG